MSVFSKAKFARSHRTRLLTRSVVINPALNTNPAFRNPTIVPFGINFVDDDLRKCLNDRDVDVDGLEKMYHQQCQDDAEFNGARLPRSYEAKLWGYIYGERLVSAQHQLNTLSKDEEHMANYLKETVEELTMRMNRFYPNLDYKSQIKAAALREAKEGNSALSEEYKNAYNEALADVISRDPTGFVKLFQNNAFIPSDADNDGSDKFGDYLPENVENELVSNYEYQWDFNSDLTANFESYYNRISKLEQVLSPKIDSLSKNLRMNFADFILESFKQSKLNDVAYVVGLIESSTNCVIKTNVDGLNNEDLVKNSLSLLDEMSNSSLLISKLFFGQNNVEKQLSGKSKEELLSVLQSVDNERLVLINKSLQIYEYLKYNSMTRLMLTCLINEYDEFFGQFLSENGDQNIAKFEEANNNILDEVVSYQSIYYENGEDLINCFNSLVKGIENKMDADVSLLDIVNLSAFDAPPCFISAIFESNLASARESGSILDQIKYSTYYNYVSQNAAKMSSISLITFLMNPSRGGVSGNSLKNMAFQFATNSSEASDALFGQITDYMKKNALTDNANTAKADLTASVQSELDNFRNICTEYNKSRNNLEESLKKVSLNFRSVNFDHAKSNYDPLATNLSVFRYYNNR